MNELAHRSAEPHLLNATIVRDHAGRSRPGFWVFVGPGSESTQMSHWWELEDPKGNLDHDVLHILEVY